MSTDKTSTACPQCGAMGVAGMFCQYCGTKIPMPVKKKELKENKATPWTTICPYGYVPDKTCIVGDKKDFPYMVVKKEESRQIVESVAANDYEFGLHQKIRTRYENDTEYAIIDRSGLFVVGPISEEIILFADNLEYLARSTDELCSLINKRVVKFGHIINEVFRCHTGDYIIYKKQRFYGFYNRRTHTEVKLEKIIPSAYEYKSNLGNGKFLFARNIGGESLECTVQIDGEYGAVCVNEQRERKLEKALRIKEEKERIKKEEEDKKEKGIVSCILILPLVIGIIIFCLIMFL